MKWSNEEIDLLKLSYPELGKCAELQALFPNRTLTAITVKASKLGLHVKNNIRKRRTNVEYLELIKDTNFISLDSYKGSTVPILHKCKLCTYQWLARPQHILKEGAKCPKCSDLSRFTTTEEVDRVLSKAGITRHSEYLGAFNPIVLEHKKCGNKWTTAYSYIQQGSGCPVCSKINTYWGDNKDNIVQVYLLKITTGTEQFLKIGVTRSTINIRINKLKSAIHGDTGIELLHIVKHTKDIAILIEHKILTKNKKYISELRFEGYTELLSLDNNIESIKQMMDTNE